MFRENGTNLSVEIHARFRRGCGSGLEGHGTKAHQHHPSDTVTTDLKSAARNGKTEGHAAEDGLAWKVQQPPIASTAQQAGPPLLQGSSQTQAKQSSDLVIGEGAVINSHFVDIALKEEVLIPADSDRRIA